MDLKILSKNICEDVLQDVSNGLTFCYYSYKQIHVEHPNYSGECFPHEGIFTQITVRHDF